MTSYTHRNRYQFYGTFGLPTATHLDEFQQKLGSELENPPLRTGERFLCIQNRSHVADDRNISSLLKKSTTFNLRLKTFSLKTLTLPVKNSML